LDKYAGMIIITGTVDFFLERFKSLSRYDIFKTDEQIDEIDGYARLG
jgi:hypothetical protein